MEGEEEKFALQFEKIARLREWNEDDLALLIQSKFKGKDEDAGDYESIKEAVLKSNH